MQQRGYVQRQVFGLLLLTLLAVVIPGRAWAAVSDRPVNVAATQDEPDTKGDSAFCTSKKTRPHPRAALIARLFDASGDEVMEWYCSGHSFGEIMLALRTSARTDPLQSAADILAMRADGASWGQIWRDTGLLGSSEPKGNAENGSNAGNNEDGQDRPDSVVPPPGHGQDKDKDKVKRP